MGRFFCVHSRCRPVTHRSSARKNLGGLTQIILTLMLFPPLAQQQQPRRCQRHAQRNQKKLHRQAQKHDQHPRKHEEDADTLSDPAAHAHPPSPLSYAARAAK